MEKLSCATKSCGSATLGYSGLLRATQGPLWPVCCGRITLDYSGLLWATQGYFGQCAVEELLWATQGYSGTTLASVLWKGYFGLGLLRATQGPLWPVCCGRATLGYSGLLRATQRPLWPVCCGRITLDYSGLLWATQGYFGQCAVEELLWATQGYSGTTLASVLWKGYFGLLRATQGPLWPVCCGRATLG